MGVLSWLRGGSKANDMRGSALVRAGQALGPWSGPLGAFVPREVNPYFYEALREAIAPIDGAINRLVTLDGILGVEGDNDRVVQLIENELFPNIAVNDKESGMQAFYAGQGNEVYEQGFAVGEMVMDGRRGRELVGLRVADSKGVLFLRAEGGLLQTWYRPPLPKCGRRHDGTDQVEAVLRSGRGMVSAAFLTQANYVQLADAALNYVSFNPEADNPYGVSLMRSMEFVAQILLKIQNATGQSWDRFGDPPMQLIYKTKNRSLVGKPLEARRKDLADMLASVLNAKRNGNSADFVQAIAADDDIIIKLIGADGNVLELEKPARHVMEQILAKAGLPAWMLGMQWSTAERLADQQSEMVLQESRTRFERRKPGLRRVVETWLRGRGVTWKAGDWALVQHLPRLQDAMKEAQARFLNAQADMMGGGQGGASADPPASGQRAGRSPRHGKTHRRKAEGDDESEPWAEPDPALPVIEDRAVQDLLALWDRLEAETLQALQLSEGIVDGARAFAFDAAAVAGRLARLQEVFIAHAGAEEGPLLQQAFAAWARGLANAAMETNTAAVIATVRAEARRTMAARGMELVRNATVRGYQEDVLQQLQAGIYDGMNPLVVARQLRQRFDAHGYDWERLARSEVAYAQSLGKVDQYRHAGIAQYDWLLARGACSRCVAMEQGGPYNVGEGPLPMHDSHPNCRCSVTPHLAE